MTQLTGNPAALQAKRLADGIAQEGAQRKTVYGGNGRARAGIKCVGDTLESAVQRRVLDQDLGIGEKIIDDENRQTFAADAYQLDMKPLVEAQLAIENHHS